MTRMTENLTKCISLSFWWNKINKNQSINDLEKNAKKNKIREYARRENKNREYARRENKIREYARRENKIREYARTIY